MPSQTASVDCRDAPLSASSCAGSVPSGEAMTPRFVCPAMHDWNNLLLAELDQACMSLQCSMSVLPAVGLPLPHELAPFA